MNFMHNALMEATNYEETLVEVEEVKGLPGVHALAIFPESLRLPKIQDPYCEFACAHVEFLDAMFAKLSGLYVPLTLRRMGLGKSLVYAAQDMAAKRSLPLYIDAVPFGVDGPPLARLREFYARMEFKPFDGHPFSMVWTPQGVARRP